MPTDLFYFVYCFSYLTFVRHILLFVIMKSYLVLVCCLTIINQYIIQCSVILRSDQVKFINDRPSFVRLVKEKRSIEKEKLAPYNDIIGVASSNVVAYSNGNDSFISQEDSYLHGIYMGMKWQCVEYARRWTYLRKGAIFSSVDGANQIWDQLKYVEQVTDKQQFPLKQHPNGSPNLPLRNSYLIYPIQRDMPYGHVAIIVGVLPNAIRVAEQNFYFHYWNSSYAREIPVVKRNHLFYINDTYEVFGWLEIDDKNQLKPLTQLTAEKLQSIDNKSRSNSLQISYFITIAFLFFSFFSR